MKDQIRKLLFYSANPLEDMEELVKEEIEKAVHRTRFFMIAGFALGTVIYHFIIK